MQSDLRMFAPATTRNRGPILELLKRIFPNQGLVLEIASGSGEHASYFSRGLGDIDWQPSEYDVKNLDSINAHAQFEKAAGVRPAIELDVTQQPWPIEKNTIDAILNCNMIHISPWEVCLGLMAGAAQTLKPKGVMVTYGPYKRNNMHTSSSNAQFDQSLKARNSNWGLRDLETVIDAAKEYGLDFVELVAMPANNFCVVYEKQ